MEDAGPAVYDDRAYVLGTVRPEELSGSTAPGWTSPPRSTAAWVIPVRWQELPTVLTGGSLTRGTFPPDPGHA